jgi:spore coat polysaccharide biosynthesis predicted glycosyltransferase SpsG
MKVLIICRGSLKDGLGHVTRSRAVALAFPEGISVRMVVIGDGCAEGLLFGRGLDYKLVCTEEETEAILATSQPDIVIFDLLYYPLDLCRSICRRATTVCLSPIFNGIGEVDLVFHRTRHGSHDWPCVRTGAERYCGLEYSVVSTHCHRIEEHTYVENLGQNLFSVAVSMGGTDAANKTLAVLEQLKGVPQRLLIWILAGEGYSHSYQKIVDTMRVSEHEVVLAKTNDSMWRILRGVSVAILAAGTTTYEAAYAGLPSINLLESQSRYYLVRELVESGAAFCRAEDFSMALESLPCDIRSLAIMREPLIAMHRRGKELIDGHGAQRITEKTIMFHRTRSFTSPAGFPKFERQGLDT